MQPMLDGRGARVSRENACFCNEKRLQPAGTASGFDPLK